MVSTYDHMKHFVMPDRAEIRRVGGVVGPGPKVMFSYPSMESGISSFNLDFIGHYESMFQAMRREYFYEIVSY
jgi:hypothetical protein